MNSQPEAPQFVAVMPRGTSPQKIAATIRNAQVYLDMEERGEDFSEYVWSFTGGKPIVNIPYTQECNDVAMMLIQHHESDYLLKRTIDQFDRLYAESAKRAKICTLAIHPYISGQPHRIKYLEQIYDYVNKHEGVLHWNGEQILDWYRSQRKA